MKTDSNRCIALAGVFQSAYLASQVAEKGSTDTQAMESSISSLFQTQPASVEAVYGGLDGLHTGFSILVEQLSERRGNNIAVSQYVIALLHLERKLAKNAAMLDQIANGIQTTQARLEHFSLLHSNILAQLADIYANSISTLRPRIMVQGDPLHLNNPENVNRIRALLLAGIRSSMLWRQCGGGRLQVIFGRKRLSIEAQRLLSRI
jgi:high frequency lysogenization protein